MSEVQGMDALASQVARVANALEGPERERRRRALMAAFPEPVRLFGGERGLRTMVAAAPGYGALWAAVVPAGYVVRASEVSTRLEGSRAVLCECGPVAVELFVPCQCPGFCGRWFLALESDVRVWRDIASREPSV